MMSYSLNSKDSPLPLNLYPSLSVQVWCTTEGEWMPNEPRCASKCCASSGDVMGGGGRGGLGKDRDTPTLGDVESTFFWLGREACVWDEGIDSCETHTRTRTHTHTHSLTHTQPPAARSLPLPTAPVAQP